jgi:hypothetical protein
MNFNSIVRKLVKKNIKEYILTLFGIAFVVLVISTLGIVISSPSVSNVFYPGGTSQQFAYGMYGMTMMSCIVFIVFIQGLFMRYKSKEIGVFMSLGVKKKDIFRLIKKELFYIVPLGAITGMVLSIPFSILLWNSLAFFFDNQESRFIIGWTGIIFAVLFSILSYFVIKIITNTYLKKINIVQLLKSTSEIESVAFGKKIFGIIGLICIPIGLIFTVIGPGTSHPILRRFFAIGLILDIIGIYLFSTQVSTFGSIVQSLSKKRYFRNIVLFNLLKLKGRQFALSLFIGTILTAIGLYSLFFNVGPAIESFEIIKNAKYDFGYLQTLDSKQMGENDIKKLASRYDLDILHYKELNGLLLVSYELFTDFSPEWGWSEDAGFVSESSFNKFFNENLQVQQGKYVIVVNYNKSTHFSNELLRPRCFRKFFTEDKKEIKITAEKTIEIKNKMFDSVFFKGIIRVLNDNDYNKIRSNIDTSYKFKYKIFNVDKYDTSLKFSDDFYDAYLKTHNYRFPESFSYRGSNRIKGSIASEKEVMQINPDIKRNWELMPYSRIDTQVNGVGDAVVYFLVFGIISLSCFVASGFIIGIKILSSIWEEKSLFRNINFLGCRTKYIKSVISRQVRLLYVFPNILAAIIVLSLYTTGFKDSMVYSDKAIAASYTLTLIIISLSMLMSIIISKKVHKECLKFISIN